jgi:hypothetical protein
VRVIYISRDVGDDIVSKAIPDEITMRSLGVRPRLLPVPNAGITVLFLDSDGDIILPSKAPIGAIYELIRVSPNSPFSLTVSTEHPDELIFDARIGPGVSVPLNAWTNIFHHLRSENASFWVRIGA